MAGFDPRNFDPRLLVCAFFLKIKGHTKATFTVSFSLLVGLSCDVLVTRGNTV